MKVSQGHRGHPADTSVGKGLCMKFTTTPKFPTRGMDAGGGPGEELVSSHVESAEHLALAVRLRVSTDRDPCVVLLRLVIQTRSFLLSFHEATGGGADTRHAETTRLWEERPLSESLQLLFGLQAAHAGHLIESGAVYLAQRRTTACAALVPPGSHLRVHLRPKQCALPEKLHVVECAEDFVVCCKPSGVPVHPTVDNLRHNLLWAAAAQLHMRLLPTSRLDEGTSGLVRLARHVHTAAQGLQPSRLRGYPAAHAATGAPRTLGAAAV